MQFRILSTQFCDIIVTQGIKQPTTQGDIIWE